MKSKKNIVLSGFFFLLFLIMLAFNILTPKMADDFAYSQSFLTGKLLTSFWDIFPSLKAHAFCMNGRLFAHFFAQLFLLLPGGIFDVVNALVFVGQCYLIYRMAIGQEKNRPLLFLAIFSAIWIFMPAFGQVNLWLDGACNYLWCTALGFLFLLPYVRSFLSGREIKQKPLQVLFFFLSVVAGGFLENGSAAFFGMSVLLLLCIGLISKKKPKAYLIWGSVGAFLGYLSIYLSPAEWSAKSDAAFDFHANFLRSWTMYREFAPLWIAFLVLLVVNLVLKSNAKRIWLSLVLVAGSLAANFMLVFASYYPERCASSVVVLLIAANAVLIASLLKKGWRTAASLAMVLIIIGGVWCMAVGAPDVLRVYREIGDNAQRIEEQRAQGNLEIILPMVQAETRFCGLYDLKYLGTVVPEDWPNMSMAVYYDVTSILGRVE